MKKILFVVLLSFVLMTGLTACSVTDNGIHTGTIDEIADLKTGDRVVGIRVVFQNQQPITDNQYAWFYYPVNGPDINQVKIPGTRVNLHCNVVGGTVQSCQFVELVR